MEMDTKQKILVAIYTEYQKDLPDMNSLNAQKLELDIEVFGIALEKLENEGLIRLPKSAITRAGMGSKVVCTFLAGTMVTPIGLAYVEEKLGIDKTATNAEKVKKVLETTTKFGLDQLKDIAAKVLAEIIKG